MQLDKRSTILLKELLLFPGIKIKNLSNKLSLSRSQVHYSLEKINDWLTENNFPTIQNDKELGIIVDRSVWERFPELISNTSFTEYVPSSIERTYFILLLLLTRQEELSLFHFSYALKVSRNTVLTDLKKTEDYLQEYILALAYSRQDGYFISGEEFDKRKLLIELVPKILNITNGFQSMLRFSNISKEQVQQLRERCESIEKKLNTRFTDEKLDELPITFLLLSRRIQYGKNIIFDHSNYNDLSNTKEYLVVQELLPDICQIDKNERLFITLQLVTSSILTFPESEDALLRDAIHHTLYRFESLACVSFIGFEELSEKIYQHMKPASYRIKYQLDMKNPLIEEVEKEYHSVHHLVKQSITPIEHLFNKELSNDEIGFLTILILGWLQQQGSNIQNQPKAIVICPNGISVSKLLIETLKNMFPDILFTENMSVRDFNKYKGEYDLVFSTVLLNTDKKVFLVKPFISEADKQNLQTRVNQEVFGTSPLTIDYPGLINVIKKYAPIEDEQLLVRDMKKFLANKNNRMNPKNEVIISPHLSDLLTSDRITLRTEVNDLEDAIRIAASPLIETNAIESRYIDSILKIVDENEPYMFIAPNVAIPHARPEDGVNELSMSMLRLDNPVEMAPGFPVKLFIVIAAVDRKTHLKALSQLNEFISNHANVSEIEQATTSQQIVDLISNHINEHSLEEVGENY